MELIGNKERSDTGSMFKTGGNSSYRPRRIHMEGLEMKDLKALQQKTIDAYNKTAKAFHSEISKLKNYDHTYDCLVDLLSDGSSILDLACGPGQISKYLSQKRKLRVVGVDLSTDMLEIAKQEIPEGEFLNESIVTFCRPNAFDAAISGFGLPYLSESEVQTCLANAATSLRDKGVLYVSFMQGHGHRVETTSFGGDNRFLIYYHDRNVVCSILVSLGFEVLAEYSLDYREPSGSITKDIVLIASRQCGPP